jgi:hypothetical protein
MITQKENNLTASCSGSQILEVQILSPTICFDLFLEGSITNNCYFNAAKNWDQR